MKLSVWAHQRGICYQTAWRLWKTGKLPVPACQLPSGTIVVDDTPAAGGVGLYARVSTIAEKDRLERQMRRLKVYAASMGWSIVDEASEVASATNDKRRGLLKLLKNKQVRTIIVETPDRIMPSGFCYLDAALQAEGRRLIALDEEFSKDDEKRLLEELIEMYTAKILGKKGSTQKAREIVEKIAAKAAEPAAKE